MSKKMNIIDIKSKGKVIILISFLILVFIVIYIKQHQPLLDVNLDFIENNNNLPSFLEVGSDECLPCKMMAPILKELKKEYNGKLNVGFIDVKKIKEAQQKYKIILIPTQIIFNAKGKELFRHEGFFAKENILLKLKELGLIKKIKEEKTLSRLDPVVSDKRPENSICSMCDGTINSKFKAFIKTKNRNILFCSPHDYFIYYSSLLNKKGAEKKLYVTDWETGGSIPALNASYLLSLDSNYRPVIKAFEKKENALTERSLNGGNILKWGNLKKKEMSVRCAFCDRVIYQVDSSLVKVNGAIMYACCAMCGLGVAARLQKDIELTVKDGLTGQPVNIQTMNGSGSSLKPETAVAWAGKKKNADGKIVSAGCFKRRFFIHENNLRKWLDMNPGATGKMVTMGRALAAKMKLTQTQINNACKIGECK